MLGLGKAKVASPWSRNVFVTSYHSNEACQGQSRPSEQLWPRETSQVQQTHARASQNPDLALTHHPPKSMSTGSGRSQSTHISQHFPGSQGQGNDIRDRGLGSFFGQVAWNGHVNLTHHRKPPP